MRAVVLFLSLKSKSVHACRKRITIFEPWVKSMGVGRVEGSVKVRDA